MSIERNFKYHAPTDETRPKFESLRNNFQILARRIEELCPESRERSVAMTHLETALFWANASIARPPE